MFDEFILTLFRPLEGGFFCRN